MQVASNSVFSSVLSMSEEISDVCERPEDMGLSLVRYQDNRLDFLNADGEYTDTIHDCEEGYMIADVISSYLTSGNAVLTQSSGAQVTRYSITPNQVSKVL